MGAGGLNGELRDNQDYIESVINYNYRTSQSGERASGSVRRQQPQFNFHTTSNSRSFPSSSLSNNYSYNIPNAEMVCYSCSVNFTLLRRKQTCHNCKRTFCKECFKEGHNSTDQACTNCLTCRSLNAPQIHKEFLVKIKVKDLQEFLRKRNISTHQCKEKRELIELVLNSSHLGSQNVPQPTQQQGQSRSTFNSSNSNRSSMSNGQQIGPQQNTNSAGNKATKTKAPIKTIDDVTSIDQVSSLSVREIKQILTVNCVDFKGCCEKEELLQKVRMLWKSKNENKQTNDSEEDSEDICKVCMDKTIDCVLLECGHMVTCLQCSKQVAECPICRQNVSRIVKVFKA